MHLLLLSVPFKLRPQDVVSLLLLVTFIEVQPIQLLVSTAAPLSASSLLPPS